MRAIYSSIFAIVVVAGVVICTSRGDEADADTPGRVDGRVEPSTRPVHHAKTPEQYAAAVEAANKLRNELLAKFPLPVGYCTRVEDGSIQIDGKLDDPAWRRATVISNFRGSYKGDAATKGDTRVRLAWDSKFLYAAFECDDADIVADIKEHDGKVWSQDAAEIFINPSGDEMSYIELEVSPIGTTFDASMADYEPSETWDVNHNNLDMDLTVARYATHSSKFAAAKTDGGWRCEMAIAFDDIARGANVNRPGGAPKVGDIWRVALCRVNIDHKPGGKADEVEGEYTVWSPTGTWFHRPWMFGRLVFVDAPR